MLFCRRQSSARAVDFCSRPELTTFFPLDNSLNFTFTNNHLDTPDIYPESDNNYPTDKNKRIALDTIMEDMLSGFESCSPSSNNSTPQPSTSGSRKGSQEIDEDPELDRLLELISQQHQAPCKANPVLPTSTSSSTAVVASESNSGPSRTVCSSSRTVSSSSSTTTCSTSPSSLFSTNMDHSLDLQLKTEAFPGLARSQPPYDFIHPGWTNQVGLMGLNTNLQCDFMHQQTIMPNHGMFHQPGFFYPNPSPQFPVIDRRGSQGTNSSSSTNHTDSPSPHPNVDQSPFASPFIRFSMLNSPEFHPLPSLPPNEPSEEDADKLCAVCNDRAVCLHYGARTCEGCKGFFKRTVQKKSKYVCAGSRNCPIDKRYRSRCQYCRFQKCLAVGMVKEIVRHGSLSGRRGRLSSKTKSTLRSDDQPSPPLPLLGLIVRAYDNCKPSIRNPSHFTSLSETQLLGLMENEFQYISSFLQGIPQTADLHPKDVEILLARSFFPILAVRHCHRIRDTIIFESGEQVPVEGLPEPFCRFFRTVLSEAANFQTVVDWDQQSFCALQAMVFLAGNSQENSPLELTDRSTIDRIQSMIVNALKDHCAPAIPNKLAKIVQQVSKFDLFHDLGLDILEQCLNMQILLPSSLATVLNVPRVLSNLNLAPMQQAPPDVNISPSSVHGRLSLNAATAAAAAAVMPVGFNFP